MSDFRIGLNKDYKMSPGYCPSRLKMKFNQNMMMSSFSVYYRKYYSQLERNKSVVFEDDDHKPGQRRTSVKLTGPPERQSSMEPSNFYDTNYRPSTKIQNPPGGASSVTFG